jgi:translation initiation factor IF-3
MGRRFSREPRGPQIRINHRIRVPEVRVVGEDGSNLGVLPTHEALQRAQSAGLDLVEVNPKGTPPVCKILDFGKYKYEEKKRQREAKKGQTIVEVKEIKLRPKTDDHDLNVKVRASRKFLQSGNKVKVICRFRGREITHPEIARQQLDYIIQNCEDLANMEQRPTMEGRTMTIIMGPKPQLLQKIQQEKARLKEEREKARARGEQVDEPVEEEVDTGETDDDDDDDES